MGLVKEYISCMTTVPLAEGTSQVVSLFSLEVSAPAGSEALC